MLTYKFRLYPNKDQQDLFWEHSRLLNNLYNFFLKIKINTYTDYKINLSKFDLDKILTDIKRINPVYFKKIHSQVYQTVTKRIDQTYKNFFKSGFGFPKFRSCRYFFNILYPQGGYNILNNKFITKQYGKINFTRHRKILGNIKQVFISRDESNNIWNLNIITDYIKKLSNIDNSNIIGIDVGISKFLTTSDGQYISKYKDPKYFDKQIDKLKSKRDKSCTKYSRRYKYLSNRIRQLYGVKNRKINDFLHKITFNLSHIYDIIVVEDLNIKNMTKSNKSTTLNRNILNCSWYKFISYLEYKCKKLIKIDPYNTSKTCSKCGKLHDLTLSQRWISCTCGNEIDRDHNAAINILCLGQAIFNK